MSLPETTRSILNPKASTKGHSAPHLIFSFLIETYKTCFLTMLKLEKYKTKMCIFITIDHFNMHKI